MENIIVFLIVVLAGAWGVTRLVRKRKTSSCSSGCAGCSCPSKPASAPATPRR